MGKGGVVMRGRGTRYCLRSGPGLSCLVSGRCGELLQSFYGQGVVQLPSLWQTPTPLCVQSSKHAQQCHSCCRTSSLPFRVRWVASSESCLTNVHMIALSTGYFKTTPFLSSSGVGCFTFTRASSHQCNHVYIEWMISAVICSRICLLIIF